MEIEKLDVLTYCCCGGGEVEVSLSSAVAWQGRGMVSTAVAWGDG
jgi:hypothetical protein